MCKFDKKHVFQLHLLFQKGNRNEAQLEKLFF